MNISAIDRQKIKQVITNESFGFVIKLYGMIALLGIVLGTLLKME